MQSVLLKVGLPPDAVAWAALALGLLALGVGVTLRERVAAFVERRPRAIVALLAASAALLSAGYLAHYLRGGPRIVDATSYFLEARALASGALAFEIPAPSGCFRGRFLLAPAEGAALSVIFPPGYPALLALGFVLGQPLAVGPAIAAALVITTYALARRMFGSTRIALLAALLGVLCAALRYHTADTMAHGWGALLLSLALLATLRGGRFLFIAGLAVGWLLATRPVTGIAGGVLVLFAARAHGRAALAPLALGVIPGLALLALHQARATGDWLSSTQLRYYALADGPPGCFRYGFGGGIGCEHEHGDFVRARLSDGFGALAAIGTTARRLHHHLLDVANFELLALLLPVAAVIGRRDRHVRLLALGIALLVVAYVPFYFDATYPGGGARLYAEVLPLEHVLLAWVLERLALGRFAPGAALVGFAVHASWSHRMLGEREGGRPMFEPAVLEAAQVTRGLVFVGTDHGFNLGHQPGSRELIVARARGDAHDHLLWQRLGRPPSYRYLYDPWSPGATPRLEPYAPAPSARFEAESEWPPLEVRGGHAHPGFPDGDCKSANGALLLAPAEGPVTVTVEVLAARAGPHRLVTGWVASEGASVQIALGDHKAQGRAGPGCWRLEGPDIELPSAPERVAVTVSGGAAWLDYVELVERSGKKR